MYKPFRVRSTQQVKSNFNFLFSK